MVSCSYKNVVDVLRKTYRSQGVLGLYRGYVATALGVMPYVGVLFFSYDTLKKTYSGDERCATKLCRHNWHSAGSLGWPFPMLKY